MENQPKKLEAKDITFSANTPEPLEQPNKPFNGATIGGVFMAPNPERTPEQKQALEETIKNIQQHRS